MKLSKHTVSILKNFMTINHSLFIPATQDEKSIVRVIPATSSTYIYGEASISETFEHDIVLYDLNKFLSILESMPNADVTALEDRVVLTEGSSRAELVFADKATINFKDKSPKEFETAVSFEIKKEILTRVLKNADILGVPEIKIFTSGDKIKIEVGNFNSINNTTDKTTNKFVVDVADNTGGNDFELYFTRANMKIITGDYTVNINPRGGMQLISTEEHEDSNTLFYCMPFNTTSKWNG